MTAFLSLRCSVRGVAALEFALLAPILITLFVGAMDVSQSYVAQLKLNAAVYAGASYAIVNNAKVTSSNGASVASAVATIVGNLNGSGWASGTVMVNNGPSASFSGGIVTSSGTAANADLYYCLSGTPGSWTWGTAQSSTSVACGTSGATAGKFVTITASYSITPLFLQLGFAAGTLTQSVAVQVQ